MRAALAVLALLAAVPIASAQTGQADTTVTVTIRPYDTPISPFSAVAAIPLVVEYTALPVPNIVPTAISLRVVEAPPWAIVSISPSTVYADPPPISAGVYGSSFAEANLLVSTTADAPAFSPANIKVEATASANGFHKQSSGTDTTLVVADYFGLLRAEALHETARYVDDGARALVRVENFGNGNTLVRFELASAPEDVRVTLPASITLEARQFGGKHVSATVPVRVTGGGTGQVVVLATPSYALDPELRGAPSEVRFDVVASDRPAIFEVQGGLGERDGLSLPVWTGILGALAGAGLYLARPAWMPGRRRGPDKP